jgi:undecaprenyl-diphosphatase
MSFWEIIILSIIQGVAEFLPISSSGHLVIANHLFGLNNPETSLLLIILLHLASLIAIIISFYDEIIDIITNNFRVLLLVIVGTIPSALIGFFLSDYIGQLFAKPFVVGIGLILTGVYMMLSELHWKSAPTSLERANIKQALWVGIAQSVAIIPGISRSGLTLATGLFNGWEKKAAIKFSFFLAIPVITGASLLKLKDFSKLSVSFQPIPILVGFIICLAVSLLSIGFLVKMVRRGHLSYFAWYCLIVGIGIIIFVR